MLVPWLSPVTHGNALLMMETDKATPTGGLPRWLSGKESTSQTGDSGRTSWILRLEDPLEEEMATPSSILA